MHPIQSAMIANLIIEERLRTVALQHQVAELRRRRRQAATAARAAEPRRHKAGVLSLLRPVFGREEQEPAC